jgi:hypothetical protein
VVVIAVELGSLASEVVADHPHDRFLAGQTGGGEHHILYFITKTTWACSAKSSADRCERPRPVPWTMFTGRHAR